MLNSVNLEEGDAVGTRLDSFLTLAARVRRCRRRHVHRRGGPGSNSGLEGPRRPSDHRSRGRPATGSIAQDIFIDPLALPLSTGMKESRRDGIETLEAIRRREDGAARACTRSSGSPTSPSASTPRPARPSTSVFLHEVRRGRSRRRHRARLEDPAAAPHRRRSPPGLSRPHLRPPPRRLRPAQRTAASVRRQVDLIEPRAITRRPAAQRTSQAPHHRWRESWPRRADLDEALDEGELRWTS